MNGDRWMALAFLIGAALVAVFWLLPHPNRMIGPSCNVVDRGADPTGRYPSDFAIEACAIEEERNGRAITFPEGKFLIIGYYSPIHLHLPPRSIQ